jgi:predicted ATP-grasp superfamily ATP-dependent carboligase
VKLTRFLDMARTTPPAVVLFSGNATGVGILRALGRHGIPIWALDPNRDSIVLHSRYAYGSVCADTHYDEEGFVRELVEIGRRLPRKGLLVPMNDDYVDMLPRHADVLAEHYLLTMPSPERMALLGDKEQQFRAAWRAQVDTPRTAFIHGPEDLAAAAEEVPFPALLKPATPLAFRRRVGRKVITMVGPDELEAAYERASGFGTLLLQELVPGGDEQLYNVSSYLDKAQRPLAVFTRRKLRQHPRDFGDIRFGESVWVPEVADAGLRLLRELGYQGISGVEFKQDPRDGRYKLMEINARSTILAHTLAPHVGVDIPYVAYRDAIGSPFTAPRQREGVRFIQCSTDVPDSLAEILRGEMGLGEWLRSLRGTRVDGILAFDDPVPGLLDVAGVVRARLARRVARDGGGQPAAS